MKFLLDQGLPRSTIIHLEKEGFKAVHTGDIGMPSATDKEIIDKAIALKCDVVTLDSDFHTIMAASGLKQPSIIRIRIEGLKGEKLAFILAETIVKTENDLKNGAAMSINSKGIRIHKLPLK